MIYLTKTKLVIQMSNFYYLLVGHNARTINQKYLSNFQLSSPNQLDMPNCLFYIGSEGLVFL